MFVFVDSLAKLATGVAYAFGFSLKALLLSNFWWRLRCVYSVLSEVSRLVLHRLPVLSVAFRSVPSGPQRQASHIR